MDINYILIAAIAVAVVALIVYLIIRNKKDRKVLEHELNVSEMTTEKNKDANDTAG